MPTNLQTLYQKLNLEEGQLLKDSSGQLLDILWSDGKQVCLGLLSTGQQVVVEESKLVSNFNNQ